MDRNSVVRKHGVEQLLCVDTVGRTTRVKKCLDEVRIVPKYRAVVGKPIADQAEMACEVLNDLSKHFEGYLTINVEITDLLKFKGIETLENQHDFLTVVDGGGAPILGYCILESGHVAGTRCRCSNPSATIGSVFKNEGHK